MKRAHKVRFILPSEVEDYPGNDAEYFPDSDSSEDITDSDTDMYSTIGIEDICSTKNIDRFGTYQ